MDIAFAHTFTHSDGGGCDG